MFWSFRSQSLRPSVSWEVKNCPTTGKSPAEIQGVEKRLLGVNKVPKAQGTHGKRLFREVSHWSIMETENSEPIVENTGKEIRHREPAPGQQAQL